MVEIEDLKCCQILGDLDDRELAEVAKLATIEKRGTGSRVITTGTNAAATYLIKEGKVEVRMRSRDGHEVVIDTLGQGDLVGWSAVLDHQMFKSDIWTVEDTTFVVLDGAKLRQLFEANNHIGYRVVRMIADIVASRMERMRARLVDQPFAPQYLAPVRAPAIPVTSEQSDMSAMPCPECATDNRPTAVVNDTEQYRCQNCGMIYYVPVGCETGPVRPSSGVSGPSLGNNWEASSPRSD